MWTASISAGPSDVVDLQRVEVLRGPQGTLFGKNTIGGAITLTSRRPSGELGGYAEVAVGSLDERGFKGAVEFPVVEGKVAARLAVSSRRREGYDLSRITGEHQNDVDSLTGRATLVWTPNDDVIFTLIGDATRQRQGGQAQHLVAFTPGVTFPALFSANVASKTPFLAFDGRWLSKDQRYNFANGPSDNRADGWGLAGTLDWRLGEDLSLTSITAYRRLKTHVGVDVDGTPLDFQSTELFDDQDQFSQELRLSGVNFDSRLNWQIGAYYFKESVHDIIKLNALPGVFNIALNQNIYLENKTYAAFGQATFKVTDALSFTGGVRYNYEEKQVTGQSVNGAVVALNPAVAKLEPDWKSWTPKLSAEYQATDAALVYASVSKGFKSGAVNYEVQRLADFQSFNPEKVTTYEAGFKTEWFDRRLRVNGAVFKSDYTDMQLKAVVQPGQYTCPTSVTTFCSIVVNAAEVGIKGAELEITARPIANFDVFAGFGWIDNSFDKIDPALAAGGVINSRTQIPKTPKNTATLGLQYTFDLGSNGRLMVRSDYSYRSKTFTEIRNVATLAQASYGLWNARIAYEPLGGAWEFALAGSNLGDEVYISSGAFLTTGVSVAAYGPPRTWTLSAKYRFGAQ